MYKLDSFIDEQYFVLNLYGDITPDDIRRLREEADARLLQLKKPAFGVVTDMRQYKSMDAEAQRLLYELMVYLRTNGMKVVARIFSNPDDPAIKTWQQANIKAGYLAMYFVEKEKAVAFVKDKVREME